MTSPAVLLGANKYNRKKTNAIIPPVFNSLDLCPPVIHDSLMFSTVSDEAVLQPLFLCLFTFPWESLPWLLFGFGNEIDRFRGDEVKLMYDHKPGRLRVSTPVDIEERADEEILSK